MSDLISLVVVVDQEPRVDSRVIASQLGVDHQNTRALIEKFRTVLERFGVCPFETDKPSRDSAGGRPDWRTCGFAPAKKLAGKTVPA